jgi:hypothetical protein
MSSQQTILLSIALSLHVLFTSQGCLPIIERGTLEVLGIGSNMTSLIVTIVMALTAKLHQILCSHIVKFISALDSEVNDDDQRNRVLHDIVTWLGICLLISQRTNAIMQTNPTRPEGPLDRPSATK